MIIYYDWKPYAAWYFEREEMILSRIYARNESRDGRVDIGTKRVGY